MISFKHKGDLSKTTSFLKGNQKRKFDKILAKYGEKGVSVLASATPVDTGTTASSWYWDVENQNGSTKLVFYNSNVNKGVNIAIILQYGHGTGTGGWVEGRDYINPALRPVFDELANEVWEEVINS